MNNKELKKELQLTKDCLDKLSTFFMETLKFIDVLNDANDREKIRFVVETSYSIVKDGYK